MYILSTPARLRRAEAHRAREGAGKGPPAVCLFLVKKTIMKITEKTRNVYTSRCVRVFLAQGPC